MDLKNINLAKFELWNRKIITSFWLICLLYVIGEFLILFLRIRYYPDYSTLPYVMDQIIIPDVLLISIMTFIELHYKYGKKNRDKVILLCSFFLADAVYLTIDPILSGGEVVMLLPLMVSVFFFNINMLLITLPVNLVTFTLSYLLSSARQENMSVFEFSLFVFMLVGFTIAGYGIIKRGQDLIKNIEELAKSEEKLLIEKTIMDKLSKTDALTGLYNHITFHEYTDSVIKQCDERGMSLQMAMLDIDNFKKINDTYGHRTGDTVIKKVGQIIMRDITPDDFAARYGGDEFALVFAGKGIEETYAIVEKIRKDVESTSFTDIDANNGSFTISIGLHDYIAQEGKESLFKKADNSLYIAKQTGKNKIQLSTFPEKIRYNRRNTDEYTDKTEKT